MPILVGAYDQHQSTGSCKSNGGHDQSSEPDPKSPGSLFVFEGIPILMSGIRSPRG